MTTAPAPTAAQIAQLAQSPAYLLDTLEWKIKNYAAIAQDATLKQEGFSIISYAWGRWHNQAKRGVAGQDGYPTFDIGLDSKGVPLTWIFPVLNKIDAAKSTADRTVFTDELEFGVKEIRAALSFMRKRYVWWDWACIPQGWSWDFAANEVRGPEFQTNPELVSVKYKEMDKMRYFYPASTRGCLWWHQTTWARSLAPSAGPGPVETVLRTIEAIKTKKTAIDINLIDTYAQQIEAARASEQSLRSLWSFQEGVLFASLSRPHNISPLESGDQLDTPSVILDRLGHNIKSMSADDHSSVFKYGQADLADLSEMTSTMAILISGALLNLGRPKEERVGQFAIGKEDAARDLLARLINTGLVVLVYDNPLPLLEARFGRTFEKWNNDVDISISTLLGPLGVEMAAEQEQAKSLRTNQIQAMAPKVEQRLKDPANKLTKKEIQDQETKIIDADLLLYLKHIFASKIFALYQWRMLLLSRGGPKTRAAASTSSLWLSLIGKERPAFASLEVYLGSDSNLWQVYGPEPDPVKVTKKVATLPALGLGPKDALVLAQKSNWCFHSFRAAGAAKQASKWTSCLAYDYVEPTKQPAAGPKIAGTVAARQVSFDDRAKVFGAGDIALLPIEALDPTSKETRTRCAVLVDYDAAKHEGVFWGIGDFGGLPSTTAVPLADSVCRLDADISIY